MEDVFLSDYLLTLSNLDTPLRIHFNEFVLPTSPRKLFANDEMRSASTRYIVFETKKIRNVLHIYVI